MTELQLPAAFNAMHWRYLIETDRAPDMPTQLGPWPYVPPLMRADLEDQLATWGYVEDTEPHALSEDVYELLMRTTTAPRRIFGAVSFESQAFTASMHGLPIQAKQWGWDNGAPQRVVPKMSFCITAPVESYGTVTGFVSAPQRLFVEEIETHDVPGAITEMLRRIVDEPGVWAPDPMPPLAVPLVLERELSAADAQDSEDAPGDGEDEQTPAQLVGAVVKESTYSMSEYDQKIYLELGSRPIAVSIALSSVRRDNYCDEIAAGPGDTGIWLMELRDNEPAQAVCWYPVVKAGIEARMYRGLDRGAYRDIVETLMLGDMHSDSM